MNYCVNNANNACNKIKPNALESIASTLYQISSWKPISFHMRTDRAESFSNSSYLVYSLSLSSNNKFLAIGSAEKSIKVWDVESMSEAFTLKGHFSCVFSVSFSNDNSLLVSGSADRSVKVWDIINRFEKIVFLGHFGAVKSVCFSHDGNYIVSGSEDCRVMLWCMITESAHKVLHECVDWVYSVKISNSRDFLCFTTANDVYLWDFITETQFVLDNSIDPICISNCGNIIATSTSDFSINIFSKPFIRPKVLISHKACITNIAISYNSLYLASSSSDNIVKIWSLSEKNIICNIESDIIYTAISFSVDGKFLFGGSYINKIDRWKLNINSIKKIIQLSSKPIIALSFSKNNRFLVCGGEDPVIKVWDLWNKKEFCHLEGHLLKINCVLFNPETTYIISSSNDCTIKLWDFKTLSLYSTCHGHKGPVLSLQLISSNTILSSSEDGTIKLWSLPSCLYLKTIFSNKFRISSLALSPNARILGLGTYQHTKFWNIEKNTPKKCWLKHEDWVAALCFSNCGKNIVCGLLNGLFKIWDFKLKTEIWRCKGHKEGIKSIFFINNEVMVTMPEKGVGKMWDFFQKCEEKADLESGLCTIYDNKKSWIVYGCEDGSVRICKMRGNFVDNKNRKHDRRSFSTDKTRESLRKLTINHYIFLFYRKKKYLTFDRDLNSGPCSFLSFYSAFCAICDFSFENITKEMCRVRISKNCYTLLHFIAFTGIEEPLKKLLQRKKVVILQDAYKKSPLFYSIIRKHDKITELLLKNLASFSPNLEDPDYFTSFNSVSYDFAMILCCSSAYLKKFLHNSIAFYSFNEFSGEIKEKYFIKSTTACEPEDFFRECLDLEKKTVNIQVSSIMFCVTPGSKHSLKLIKSLINAKDPYVLSVPVIKSITSIKWNSLKSAFYAPMLLSLLYLGLLLRFFTNKSLSLLIRYSFASIGSVVSIRLYKSAFPKYSFLYLFLCCVIIVIIGTIIVCIRDIIFSDADGYYLLVGLLNSFLFGYNIVNYPNIKFALRKLCYYAFLCPFLQVVIILRKASEIFIFVGITALLFLRALAVINENSMIFIKVYITDDFSLKNLDYYSKFHLVFTLALYILFNLIQYQIKYYKKNYIRYAKSQKCIERLNFIYNLECLLAAFSPANRYFHIFCLSLIN